MKICHIFTGYRLKSRDVLKAGIATHFCDSEKIPKLEEALLELHSPYSEDISKILAKFEEESTLDKDKEFTLKPFLPLIDDCFSGETIETVLDNLKKVSVYVLVSK